MSRKELTKTFMMISSWKKPFSLHGLWKNNSVLEGLNTRVMCDVDQCKLVVKSADNWYRDYVWFSWLAGSEASQVTSLFLCSHNMEVGPFLKIVALCSSLGGKYYRYIVLMPIKIDSLMICCSKNIEISKHKVNRKSLLVKIILNFFLGRSEGRGARAYYVLN